MSALTVWLSALIGIFCLVRLVHMIEYRRNYHSKPGSEAAQGIVRGRADRLMVVAVSVALVPLPVVHLWTDVLQPLNVNVPTALRWFGVLIYGMGLGLFTWTSLALGRNWSATVEIRDEHTLVTTGLYRYVRHPMYLAFYLLAIGLFVACANWLVSLAALLSWATLYHSRVGQEEAVLQGEFGDQYVRYMRRTGRLLPRVLRHGPAS